jgi:hypothetical protein
MAYRYTDTDKWNDAWFSELNPLEKLLFNYLCDNCDIAGFLEVIPRKIAVEIKEEKAKIEGALKGLERGLIYSNSGDCLYIRNFLKHQKNLPLNPNNKAHQGIIKRFELYSYKFDIKDINLFIEGACKGLLSPTGNGNGNGNGNGKEEGLGETNNFENRNKKFYDDIVGFANDYPKDMLSKFYNYWSELNKSGKKMRFELEKTWELSKRLNTWANRDNTFKNNAHGTNQKNLQPGDFEVNKKLYSPKRVEY